MIVKLPIEIDGKQYRLCTEEQNPEDVCEKCAFCDAEDCPDDICMHILPRSDTYFEKA